MAQQHNSGVRWSGMSDEPSWTPSPEAQAKAYAAYIKAKDKFEADLAAKIAARKAAEHKAAA